MDLSKYVANIMYNDKLNIIRYKDVDNGDGTSGKELDTSGKVTDIPCHISILKADEASAASVDVEDIVARIKVFVAPTVEIFKGDMLIADKYLNKVKVQSYEGKASDPVFYDLSQEVILLEKRVKNARL